MKKQGKTKESSKSRIGLGLIESGDLAEKLNDLLANYQVLYMNTRGFHWNIRGEKFFELHLKFEELYSDFQLKIDEIAERILTLGHTPLHSFEHFLKKSKISVVTNETDGLKCVRALLDGFEVLLAKQRTILELAANAGDEGTNALMSDYIREQEKLVWMYSAFLSK